MTTSSDLMADSNVLASLCSRRVSVVGVMSLPECRSCGQVPGRVRVNTSKVREKVALPSFSWRQQHSVIASFFVLPHSLPKHQPLIVLLTNMADYDSDSSAGGDDIETNVLLGYASKEPTIDDFSQLGGHPVRLVE